MLDTLTDRLLVEAIRRDSQQALVEIFRIYYEDLVLFCGQFVAERAACEDIVQEVFIHLWENRKELRIRRSLKSYLTVLVQNRALDELRHDKVKARYASDVSLRLLELSPEEHLFYNELNNALNSVVDELEPTLRDTLLMSVRNHLTYPQIAAELGVSVRTVESRISRAMKIIRQSLNHFKTK